MSATLALNALSDMCGREGKHRGAALRRLAQRSAHALLAVRRRVVEST